MPGTLRFLAANRDYPPALIAAFGIPEEVEPGLLGPLSLDRIAGVQLTQLLADGSSRLKTPDAKKIIGHFVGIPIVVAPPNDLLGLAIAEGIEDALSVYQATGLGSWASASAIRLPKLADTVPNYVRTVTLMVDDDPDGERASRDLEKSLMSRGIEVIPVRLRRPS